MFIITFQGLSVVKNCLKSKSVNLIYHNLLSLLVTTICWSSSAINHMTQWNLFDVVNIVILKFPADDL